MFSSAYPRAFVALAALVGVAATSTAANAATNGQQLYTANCSSCHQAKGQGISRAFPPLAHNAFVTGNAKPVIQTVLNGKNGAITVNAIKYNGAMPPWKSKLSDAQIADVVNYIRSSWGNHASKVSQKQVKQDGG